MAISPMSEVIQHLRRAVLERDGAGMTDGQLLECFLSQRDEAAFAGLVRRHGPMVWGVCRRVLRDDHGADDAFQATFLVLVRKAAAIVPREMVANWLYGVAYNTAVKARALAARRQVRERQVRDMPEPEATEQDLWTDLQPLLDQELSRLPEKYRAPIVLCDLDGKTRKEAAQQLGVPEGSVAGWLARARALLAKRLTRRGLHLSGGALATMLAQNAASACVPATVVTSTIQAATLLAAGQAAATGAISANVAALTEGVLKAMLMTKLKLTAAFLVVVGLIATGGGMFAYRTLADSTADTPIRAAQNPDPSLFDDFEDADPAQRRQDAQERGGITLGGILKAVDADKRRVTITIPPTRRDPQGAEKNLPVAKDAKILRDTKEVKLGDLKNGARVTLKLTADQATVTSITEMAPTVSALLKSVDAKKNTVTVTVDNARKGKSDKTYQVAKDAKVAIDGKAATLSDLKEGAMFIFTVSVDDANTVIQIQSPGRRPREE